MKYLRASIAATVLVGVGVIPRLMSSAATRDNTTDSQPRVRVVHPAESGNETMTLPATLIAYNQFAVAARANGYVAQRLSDIGNRVKKGQVLALISIPEVEQQTREARADVDRTKAGERQAQAQTVQAAAALSAAQSNVSEARARQVQSEANLATYRARLDEARHTVASRKADEARLSAQLALATKTNERWVRLLADGAVPPQDADQKRVDYETARANMKSAIALVAEARAEYVAAEKQIEAGEADLVATTAALHAAEDNANAARAGVVSAVANTEATHAVVRASVANVTRAEVLQHYRAVTAPYDGVITSRNLNPGQLVDPSTVLYTMADQHAFRIQVHVPEDQLANIHLHQVVNVTVLELPGKVYQATVTRFAGALDESAKTLLVEMDVPNIRKDLYIGMYAQVHFNLKSDGSLLIPGTALLFNGDGTQVIKIVDGKTVYQKVQVGRDFGTKLEVKEGLKPTDNIMLIPSVSYANGTAVSTEMASSTPTPSPTPSGSATP